MTSPNVDRVTHASRELASALADVLRIRGLYERAIASGWPEHERAFAEQLELALARFVHARRRVRLLAKGIL